MGEQLGVNAETLRGRVRQMEVDEGQRPGTTMMDAEKLDKPGREVKELPRTQALRPGLAPRPGAQAGPGSHGHADQKGMVRNGDL